jgi:hypothetical protein
MQAETAFGVSARSRCYVVALPPAPVDFCRWRAHTLVVVLRFRKPPVSFVCFLLFVVGLGAVTGYFFDAVGLAAFFYFVASIEAKPAWKFWWNPPAKRETGRASCAINSYQRVGATSPKEIRQLPNDRWFGRDRHLQRHG